MCIYPAAVDRSQGPRGLGGSETWRSLAIARLGRLVEIMCDPLDLGQDAETSAN